MAYTLTFPTSADLLTLEEISEWLMRRGEPFECPNSGCVQLRAVDVRVELDASKNRMRAHLEVSSTLNLTRVVDLVFELSILAGADVRLAGHGEVSRGALWLQLADEQDRLRITESLQRAEVHGRREEVGQRLWQVVAAIRRGHDDRWDTRTNRIVELKEVGDEISLADASWHADDPQIGDVIPVGVEGSAHSIAWRWLSEAYPGLAEYEHTFQ